MSTILKALRRLEDDRAIGDERPLRESVTAGATKAERPARERPPSWMLAVALVVAVGATGVVVALTGDAPEEPTQLAAAAPAATGPAPAARRAPPAQAAAAAARAAATRTPPPSAREPVSDWRRELPAEALDSPVELVRRPPAGPRIDDAPATAEAEAQARPGQTVATPRLVRGKPLVPPEALPGRHAPAPANAGAGGESATDEGAPSRSRPVPPWLAKAPQPVAEREEIVAAAEAAGVKERVAAPRQTAAAAKPAPAPKPAPVAKSEPAPEATARPEPRPAPRPEPKVAAATASDPAPATAPSPQPAPVVVAAASVSKPEPAAAEPQQAAAAPSTQASASAAEPPPEPAMKSASTPEPSAPPAPAPVTAEAARASAPVVVVARTSWHPVAERRAATIRVDDGAAVEVREGEAVGPLVVTRIEPSRVVFQHLGVEIRRKVGEQ